jgi:copper transport protein
VAGTLALLVGAAPASAHAYLQTSDPGPRAVVGALPAALQLRFDEDVVPRFARVAVIAPDGQDLAGAPIVTGPVVTVALGSGARGSYTVRWSMVASDDGHLTEGAFSFGVRASPLAPAPAHGVGIPVAPQVLAWLQFMCVVLSGGLLTARALLWAPTRRRPDDGGAVDSGLALAGAIGGAAVGIHAGLLAFLTGAYPIVGSGLSGFVDTEIEPIRVQTHLGQAWMLMTFAWFAVLALLVAAWTTPRIRERLMTVAGLGTLVIAFGLSWASHPASRGWAALVADYLHLVAAALWVGGLLGLAILAWRARAAPRTTREAIVRRCLVRFARLAAPAVAVVAVAGVFLATNELPAVSDLVSTGYGRALLGKSAVAVAALGLAGYHRFLVVPRVAVGASLAGIRRTILVEVGLLVVVLVLAAVLTQAAPPA